MVSSQVPCRYSCCHRRCRPSWKSTGHSNDLYGEHFLCDAVCSTCLPSRIIYSLFDPRQLAEYRKHCPRTMVVWKTICKLHYLVLRYFYLNTALHLIAVSYERYSAIVKSPLTYDGSITRSKVVVIVLIWTVPVLVVATAFFRQAESAFIIRNCSFTGQLQMPLLFMLPLRHSSCSLCQFQ